MEQPNALQLAHSGRLTQAISETILKNGGWIGFDEFMNLALYYPGLGYYSAGATKFGEQGDFITAPLLGKQFAECIAAQCNECLNNLESKSRMIAEFGAGTGQLALDILIALSNLGELPAEYLVVETSPELRQRQYELIANQNEEILNVVKWIDDLPKGFCGVVLGNELLDALPVKRFEIDRTGEIKELGVALSGDGLIWQIADETMAKIYQRRLKSHDLPEGYQSELGVQAEAWVRSCLDKIKTGVLLLIDYGFPEMEYYHPDRNQGTLMCHYRHQAHDDPFYYPGLQDITAHVDFSAVARAGLEVRAELAGYCNQANFLISLGLLERCEKNIQTLESETDMKRHLALTQEIKKLTLPHEMGELFKVIALTKNYSEPMRGFSMQNNLGCL